MRNFIVTGTDTEVGKTYVSCLIIKSLREAGINAAGFKPVACGDRQDARLLREAGPKELTLDDLNPVFEECHVSLCGRTAGEYAGG